MAIALNKLQNTAPAQNNLTLTPEQLNDLVAAIKEQLREEIKEEIKQELILPLLNSITQAREQSKQCTTTLEELEKKVNEIYAPIKNQRAAAARERLANHKIVDDIDEEDE